MAEMPSFPSPGAKLALALSKAQAKIKAPLKNRKVDFLDKNGRRVKYNYADLADVIESCREPLAEFELAVFSSLVYENIKGDETSIYGLKTFLIHSSGEFVDTFYPLPDPMLQTIRAQEFGSALTYARRYSYSSLIGIASEEDDDGGIAADSKPPLKKTDPKPLVNHAPVQQEPDLDQALGKDPSQKLNDLYDFVDAHKVQNHEVKKIIRVVTGRDLKSTDLKDAEIDSVMNYLKLLIKGSDYLG